MQNGPDPGAAKSHLKTSTKWNTLLGKKAWAIAVIWVENTVNYGVLEQVVWQEIWNH